MNGNGEENLTWLALLFTECDDIARTVKNKCTFLVRFCFCEQNSANTHPIKLS